jgi:hypothetical protein
MEKLRPAPPPFALVLQLVMLLLPVGMAAQGPLFLNEVMASNSGLLLDDTGDAADWIEIYNGSAEPIDLSGHFLSDDLQQPQKHQLPASDALVIPPHGHLVLWASGEPSRGPVHLGFKLDVAGEPVLLTSPAGVFLDLIATIPHYTDISYGRAGDGGSSWGYFQSPTPGAPNSDEVAMGRVSPPEFSVPPGSHAAPLVLDILHPNPDAIIYYTLDGSTPDPTSQDGRVYQYKLTYPNVGWPVVGALYNDTLRTLVREGPLELQDPSPLPNHVSTFTTNVQPHYPNEHMPVTRIRKAQVVRAVACLPGHLPSRVVTGTWFLHPSGAEAQELPVISLVTDRDNLFSWHYGNYNPGIDYETWRLQHMFHNLSGDMAANWTRKDEFPISMEFFEEGEAVRTFQRDAGYRIHGMYSRLLRRKSMRFYFRERHGHPTVDHKIFHRQDERHFKRLILHTNGNDECFANMRDRTLQEMVSHMRCETQDSRPVVVFINGEYWGVHAIRERYDEHYLKRTRGLNANEVDIVERYRRTVRGDSLAWCALLDQVAAEDPANPAVYEDLQRKIDLDDHIDHHVINVFAGNQDWPQNNWKAYRKKTQGYVPGAPHGHDGRWRWLTFDLDFGFNLVNVHGPWHGFLSWAMEPDLEEHTILFRRLLRNTGYRHGFINRSADMLNTAFRAEVVKELIEARRDEMAHDMHEHVRRWPDTPVSHPDWLAKVDVMLAFASERPQAMRAELMGHFNLPHMHQLQVDVSHQEAGWVELNTIHLRPGTRGVDGNVYPWQGIYFEQVPVRLVAHAHPGWRFSHWEGAVSGTDSVATLSMVQAATVIAIYEPLSNCPESVLHYWHFNALPSGPLERVTPDASHFARARITYPGTGSGRMERTSIHDGTSLNAQDAPAGRGLCLRDPDPERSLFVEVASTGHHHLRISYATRRTEAAPDSQRIWFSVDPEQPDWQLLHTFEVSTEYQLIQLSLEGVVETFNAGALTLRIDLSGPGSGEGAREHHFDNLTVLGTRLPHMVAEVCEDAWHSIQGTGYPAGIHLHEDEAQTDCGRYMIVEVREVMPDPSVEVIAGTLVAVERGATYQWFDCRDMSPVPGAIMPMFEPRLDGSYGVAVRKNGCSVTSACHAVADGRNGNIFIHPNPAREVVNIQFSDEPEGAWFELMDMTGRLVMSGLLSSHKNDLDVGGLPRAPYMLSVGRTGDTGAPHRTRIILQ